MHKDPLKLLERDLALVLPTVHRVREPVAMAAIEGFPVEMPQAIAAATKLLTKAVSPAVTGLQYLTIEAVRHVVALTELLRGRLLPFDGQVPDTIQQTATLGHIYASDLVIFVTFCADTGPISSAITSRVKQTLQLDSDLPTVMGLRADPDGFITTTIGHARRVAVVLSATTERRVVSQWHKLAADIQQKVRMAVVQLPDAQAANLRGADEVVTWQTGLTLQTYGIDFADGVPRPANRGSRGGRGLGWHDVLLDAGATGYAGDARRIVFSRQIDKKADVCFVTPGLAIPLSGQVMRFDGTLLWLCDDPATAPSDPTAQVLDQLLRSIRS